MNKHRERHTAASIGASDSLYLDLMNLNFLNNSVEETEQLFHSLQDISGELEDKELIKMLHDTWRPSKVSAC